LTGNSSKTIFTNMTTQKVKDEALQLIDTLPENVTWDDIMHTIYVRQSIEAGLADSKASKTVNVNEVIVDKTTAKSKLRLRGSA